MPVFGPSRPSASACRTLRAAVGWALLGSVWLPACGEDGAGASCPEVPLYDVRSDAGLDPNIAALRQEAADRGCLTLEGDASLLGDDPGQEEEESE